MPNTKVKLFLRYDLSDSSHVKKMSMSKLLQPLVCHMLLPNLHFSFTILPIFQTHFSMIKALKNTENSPE